MYKNVPQKTEKKPIQNATTNWEENMCLSKQLLCNGFENFMK